jgi:hypothetical protein
MGWTLLALILFILVPECLSFNNIGVDVCSVSPRGRFFHPANPRPSHRLHDFAKPGRLCTQTSTVFTFPSVCGAGMDRPFGVSQLLKGFPRSANPLRLGARSKTAADDHPSAPGPPASHTADSFAKLVLNGFEVVHLNETQEGIPFGSHPPSADRMMKYCIHSNGTDVEAWVLPSKILPLWVIFNHNKQYHSLFSNILIRRMDPASLGREKATMELLKDGSSAVWIGLSGIGKSVSTMVLLVEALQNVIDRNGCNLAESDRPDGFDEVYYRVGQKLLFRFYWDGKTLRGQQITDTAEIEQILNRFIPNLLFVNKTEVLFVELDEREQDPDQRGLFTASARRAYEETFKTLRKRKDRFFLMEPPSEADLRLMYLSFKHLSVSPLPKNIDSYEKFSYWQRRIGPVPRYLFCELDDMNDYLSEREDSTSNVMPEIEKISISNVGEHLKYFMAPFIREDVTVPKLPGVPRLYEFRFLSDECKLMLAHLAKQSRFKRVLKRSTTYFA